MARRLRAVGMVVGSHPRRHLVDEAVDFPVMDALRRPPPSLGRAKGNSYSYAWSKVSKYVRSCADELDRRNSEAWLGAIRPTSANDALDPALWATFVSMTLGVGVPVLSSLPRLHQQPARKCGCKKHALDLYGDRTSTCAAHSGAIKAHLDGVSIGAVVLHNRAILQGCDTHMRSVHTGSCVCSRAILCAVC